MSRPFLTEEEYKEDIFELFCFFDFEGVQEAGEGEGEKNHRFMDPDVLKWVFEALGQGLGLGLFNRLEKLMDEKSFPGCPYSFFEEQFLKKFPYDSKLLLDEAIRALDPTNSGSIKLDKMQEVARSAHTTFSDGELAELVKTFGKSDQIRRDQITALFS
jgi:Ca2+-binding EF-hand superfamily protein